MSPARFTFESTRERRLSEFVASCMSLRPEVDRVAGSTGKRHVRIRLTCSIGAVRTFKSLTLVVARSKIAQPTTLKRKSR